MWGGHFDPCIAWFLGKDEGLVLEMIRCETKMKDYDTIAYRMIRYDSKIGRYDTITFLYQGNAPGF